MVGAGSAYGKYLEILSWRLSLPACSLMSMALAVTGLVSEAMRYKESPDAATPGAICPRPRSRTTCSCWLMDIEQAALAGIAMASNFADSAAFRSTVVAGTPGLGAVAVAPCPQPIPTAATSMTNNSGSFIGNFTGAFGVVRPTIRSDSVLNNGI